MQLLFSFHIALSVILKTASPEAIGGRKVWQGNSEHWDLPRWYCCIPLYYTISESLLPCVYSCVQQLLACRATTLEVLKSFPCL